MLIIMHCWNQWPIWSGKKHRCRDKNLWKFMGIDTEWQGEVFGRQARSRKARGQNVIRLGARFAIHSPNLLKLFSSFRPSPRLHAEPSSRAGVELMVLSRLLRHTQAALLRRCSQTDCWRYKARKNKYFLSENTPHHLPVSTFHRRHRELWLPTVAGDVISFNRLPPLGIVSV